ncbi:olfactory receptor 6N1-like [Hypomesus transpacificus]|uniref:olfactory receptor 6N1-like n=1 Tax=Hypomesus transpacificus TaxID=137520 RepID=UPI001F078F71|nr:olfactory receptor 6N1-like [Hypomesus transpacificus]
MNQGNNTFTQPSEFVIVGFPGIQPEYYNLTAWLFLFLYVITVGGNSLLVVLFAVEHSLQKPMYIIMVSLALSDIGFDTVALPKIIARYWWNDGSISYHTCMIQTHIIHFFGTLNSLIMMTMALDRSLAICFPLRYPVLMTNRIMTCISIISWMAANIGPGTATFNYSQLVPYCKSNKILHIYCDMVSLVLLSCGDISSIVLRSTSVAMLILLGPLSLIILSYACVIVTVMKMATLQGKLKTLSTCVTQGLIIFIYYIPRFVVYSTYLNASLVLTNDIRIGTTVFYSLFPPLINPFIYCLRTKEIKQLLRRWVQRWTSNDLQKSNKISSITKKHTLGSEL